MTTKLIVFTASWCKPCKEMAPALEGLRSLVEIDKLDIEAHPMAANQYGVRSVPALFLERAGKIVTSHFGGMTESALRRWLAENGAFNKEST